MLYKKVLPAFIFLVAAAVLSRTGFAEEQQGVLEPEGSNEARLNKLQPPGKVMDAIGIAPGMALAEIGAGRGRYVVQLAVRVGEKGKIYAEDIDADALDHLEKRCRKWQLDNVKTILGKVTEAKLPANELDLIFIISAYHHFSDPVALLRKARSSLKPGGKLAIVEWLPKSWNSKESTSPEQMESQMKKAGYKLERIDTCLNANNINIYIFQVDGAGSEK